MSAQVTIIGLGQIGASIGLALDSFREKILRVGFDPVPQAAHEAKKIGALDRVTGNLSQAVREADLIVLALPVDQIRTILTAIASELKENAVVVDTALIKTAVLEWAQELLPAGRHFVGMTPVINPAYLLDFRNGLSAARHDLFKDGLMAIVTAPGTDSGAIKMAADLTAMVGASPLFSDTLEVDSFMAATHLLPQILAAALLDATASQAGWSDGRKFAGREFAQVTAPVAALDHPAALIYACLHNRENVRRVIGDLIQSLQSFQQLLAEEEDADLDEMIRRVSNARSEWWDQRSTGQWSGEPDAGVEIPSPTSFLGGLFMGRRPQKDDGA